ncbi:MAG TPA: hypothetical protein VLT37_09430 [Acidocella sp.]|nr:hypothetical protein [Acidocella sp.]
MSQVNMILGGMAANPPPRGVSPRELRAWFAAARASVEGAGIPAALTPA